MEQLPPAWLYSATGSVSPAIGQRDRRGWIDKVILDDLARVVDDLVADGPGPPGPGDFGHQHDGGLANCRDRRAREGVEIKGQARNRHGRPQQFANRGTRIDGARVIDKPWVRENLARVYAKVQTLRLMNWKQAWAAQAGQPNLADASAIKVYGSELNMEAYRLLMEITNARAGLGPNSPGAVLQGRIESAYKNGLIVTFGGGANEVQRDIIAMAGMGLPHYKS